MGFLDKRYQVIKDSPREISWDDYYNQAMAEYEELLDNNGDDEKVFQTFFEKNPSFVPGALELFGQSGHYPYMDTMISQPSIGGVFKRIPDFLWLAQDSLNFCPVFIEIERPNKNTFTKQGDTTADFNQALGQLKQWSFLMKNPTNIQLFYEYFKIPIETREKVFTPQYLLIYGRRSEYIKDIMLRGIRSENQKENIAIFSYDRLQPLADYRQFITCKISNAQYDVINISPTFRYRADCATSLPEYNGFCEKIDCMEKTSLERKEFLKSRYLYWCDFAKSGVGGMICSQEGE